MIPDATLAPARLGLRVLFAAALSLSAAAPAFAQAAGIVRPSRVSDSTRQLRLRPVLAGFQIGERMAGAVARLGTPVRVDTFQSQSDPVLSVADQRTGITIIGNRADGVAVVLVSRDDAGTLDSSASGIRAPGSWHGGARLPPVTRAARSGSPACTSSGSSTTTWVAPRGAPSSPFLAGAGNPGHRSAVCSPGDLDASP